MSVSDYSHNHMFLLSRLVISARFPVPHVYTKYSMSHLFEIYPKLENFLVFIFLNGATGGKSWTQKAAAKCRSFSMFVAIPLFRGLCRIRDKLP